MRKKFAIVLILVLSFSIISCSSNEELDIMKYIQNDGSIQNYLLYESYEVLDQKTLWEKKQESDWKYTETNFMNGNREMMCYLFETLKETPFETLVFHDKSGSYTFRYESAEHTVKFFDDKLAYVQRQNAYNNTQILYDYKEQTLSLPDEE